jgi:hypothetical protein
MKTFLHYLSEQEKIPVYKQLRPAVKYPDGNVARGARGKDHSEIRADNAHKYDEREGEAGFWHPKEKRFLTRKEAAAHAPRPGSSGESTEMLSHDEKERRKNRQKRETSSRGSMSSADLVSDVVRAHRASKYGSPNEYRFEEEAIQEGNPLSRIARSDRHSITMSAERKGLTSKENAARMKELRAAWRERGYGYRKVEGKWDEGGGVGRENSIHVTAKGNSKEDSAELLKHAKELGAKHDQDAVLHRGAGGRGTAIYTSNTASGRKKGEKDSYGPSRYNVDNPYGETQFKPRKPEKARPKLTFKPKSD